MSKSIIIDPGHGGTDPGAVGFGAREKDWNLRISLYQYNRLKELGAKVAITRTADETIDSVPRTDKIKGKDNKNAKRNVYRSHMLFAFEWIVDRVVGTISDFPELFVRDTVRHHMANFHINKIQCKIG